jgi:sugar phosphate isomerase/epimerase
VYVNLDTANVIMYGFGNPVEAVYTLKQHIRSLHVKDGLPPTEPNKLGPETPIGEGFVDFKRVFSELEKVGYNGPLIIEREIKGEKQTEDIKKAVRYLNEEIFI